MPIYNVILDSGGNAKTHHIVKAEDAAEAIQQAREQPEKNYQDIVPDWSNWQPGTPVQAVAVPCHECGGRSDDFCLICSIPICSACEPTAHPDSFHPAPICQARCPGCRKRWVSATDADAGTAVCPGCGHVGLLIEVKG